MRVGVPQGQKRSESLPELLIVKALKLALVHLRKPAIDLDGQAEVRGQGGGRLAGSPQRAGPDGIDRADRSGEPGCLKDAGLVERKVCLPEYSALYVPKGLAVANDEQRGRSGHAAARAISDKIPRVAHEHQQERF